MGRFRDEMRKGRAVLHETMGDRAIIFAWPPEYDENDEPIAPELTLIKVRVLEKFQALGDLKGTNFHYAEMADNSPIAVFWTEGEDGFIPERGFIFITEYERAYRIESTDPKDDQTQNASVIELLPVDKIGMPKFSDYEG